MIDRLILVYFVSSWSKGWTLRVSLPLVRIDEMVCLHRPGLTETGQRWWFGFFYEGIRAWWTWRSNWTFLCRGRGIFEDYLLRGH